MEIAQLSRTLDELKQRISDLESQVREIRQTPFRATVMEGEWDWVDEIEGIMEKWFARERRPVIISACRAEQFFEGHQAPKPWSWVNGGPIEDLTQIPPDKVMFLLSPFSSDQRLKILLLLEKYPRSSTDLTNALGFQGGQLYHHLDELMKAKYIEKVYKGKYSLTNLGRWGLYNSLLTAKILLSFMEKEQEPESTEKADG